MKNEKAKLSLSDDLKSKWYALWFDSPYYHLLYAHRSQDEADKFIRNLVHKLEIKRGSKVLDLACGSGRHAAALAEYGLIVTGKDLSLNNIKRASLLSKVGLRFIQGDMLQASPDFNYDYVMSLFTSFGYFDTQEENRKVVRAVADSLLEDGKWIIDYLNPGWVLDHLVAEESIERGDIIFTINKEIKNNAVYKHIHFTVEGHSYSFTEQVKLYTLTDIRMLLAPHFTIEMAYGNYELAPYVAASPRMIILAKKDGYVDGK